MDDALVLRAIRAVDARLGEQYLEHLVLNRRNSVSTIATVAILGLTRPFLRAFFFLLMNKGTGPTYAISKQLYRSVYCFIKGSNHSTSMERHSCVNTLSSDTPY